MSSLQLRPISWQWVAAFFCGEGCICVKPMNYRHPEGSWTINLGWYQNDLTILDEITMFLYENGVRSIYLKANKRNHVLQVSARADVIFVLSRMLPYIRGEKREQAIEALKYLRAVERLVSQFGTHFRRQGIKAPVPPKQVRERR